MLVNKNSEGYKEIKEELFRKIFSTATKHKKTNPNKLNLLLLLALFAVGFYYFSSCVYWEEAMDIAKKPIKKNLKSKRREKKIKDDEDEEKVEKTQNEIEDDVYESDWSDRLIDRIIMYTDRVRKPIKKALPDFHELRAINNIFLTLISNFNGLDKEVTQWIIEEKILIEDFVVDRSNKYLDMELFNPIEEEELNEEESEAEEDDGSSDRIKKWAKETLSSEEVEAALDKLFNIDLQKLVIENSLNFTTTRTLDQEDYDDDEGSNGLSDEENEDCCGEDEDCCDEAS